MEENIVTFYSNSYFDDVIGFLHAEVHTWQDKFKRFNCEECERELYEAKNNKNKTEFVELINKNLKLLNHSRWPYKNKLFVQISISTTPAKLEQSDIDNLVKTVFDAIKGVVCIDDNQIYVVYAEKHTMDEIPMSSFIFAIKELELKEDAKPQASLWSADKKYTEDLRVHRDAIGRPSIFHIFQFENKLDASTQNRLKKIF